MLINRQQHITTALLLLFVLGSVVAPFSHYVYMMSSDAYGVGHHESGDSASHGASHASTQVSVDAKSTHIVCDYWSLFATFAATTPASPVILAFFTDGKSQENLPVIKPLSNKPLTFHLRGPPASFS